MQYFLHNIPINATQVQLEDPALHRLALLMLALRMYYIPVMASLGIVFNCLMAATFLLTKIRKFSYAPYMSGLATADSLFLLTLLLVWLKSANPNLDVYNREGWCQAITYISSVAAFLATWYTVGYVVDRFICLTFPHEKKKMCTAFRTKMVVLGLVMTAVAVFLNLSLLSWVVRTNSGDLCVGMHMNATIVLSKMDIFFNLILPYSGIVALGIGILRGLKKTKHRRKSFRPLRCRPANSRQSPASFKRTSLRKAPASIRRVLSGGGDNDNKATPREPVTTTLRDIRSSRSLLLFSLSFILLSLPSQLLQLYTMLCSFTQLRFAISNSMFLWQHLTLCLFYTRCAINFPLYLCCSKLFRSAFKLLFVWPCQQNVYFSSMRNMSIRYSIKPRKENTSTMNGIVEIGERDHSMTPLTAGSQQITELGL